MKARRPLGRTLVLLALGALAVIYIFPFVWLVSTSLKPTSELYKQPPTFWPQRPTLAPYQEALFGAGDWLLRSNTQSPAPTSASWYGASVGRCGKSVGGCA